MTVHLCPCRASSVEFEREWGRRFERIDLMGYVHNRIASFLVKLCNYPTSAVVNDINRDEISTRYISVSGPG